MRGNSERAGGCREEDPLMSSQQPQVASVTGPAHLRGVGGVTKWKCSVPFGLFHTWGPQDGPSSCGNAGGRLPESDSCREEYRLVML